VPSIRSDVRGLKEKYELHHGVRITDSARSPPPLSPIATSPTASRQGHRPGRRVGRALAAVVDQAQAPTSLDRRIIQLKTARGAEEGKRPGVAGPSRPARKGFPTSAAVRLGDPALDAEGKSSVSATSSASSRPGRTTPTAPSAPVTSLRPASSFQAASPSSASAWVRKPGRPATWSRRR
jgi:hypothetical protein